MANNETVQAVKAYAKANYNVGGWDIVVECYSDRELAEELDKLGATDSHSAIKLMGSLVGKVREVEKDWMAEANGEAIAAGEVPIWKV
jgi:hypothetical protein